MKLAVVTVVKDDFSGLLKTEQSIKSQSKPVFWFIVTPNNSSEINAHCQKLLVSGLVTKIISDSGSGVYNAMNAAVWNAASSDWIWFLNAGDEFSDSNSYSNILQVVKSTKSNWIFGGNFLGSKDGKILGLNAAPKKFVVSNQLFARKYICHQSTIFNAGFLRHLGGFRTQYQIAADWDLMVRASRVESAERVNIPISVFYMGGISSMNRELGNKELLSLRKEHLSPVIVPISYFWYGYRKIRNILVGNLESVIPNTINSVRHLRLLMKQISHRYREKF